MLNEIEKKLLVQSTTELLNELICNNETREVKTKAFQTLIDGKEVQVQIIATTYKNDFLDDFCIETTVDF